MSDGGADFWPRVRLYREMGLDPLKWIAGCSVEVDREEVLFPAVAASRDALAGLGVTVHPREGPDVFELRDESVHLDRTIVQPAGRPARARQPRRGNPRRAALTMRVFQRRADDPEGFARALVGAVEGLPGSEAAGAAADNPITIGRLHAVTTPHEGGEFALFDFYGAGAGAARGHTAVGCDTLQVADASLPPLAEEHAQAVVASALSGVLALGASINIRVAPTFDGPGKKTVDALAANFQAAARRHGFAIQDGPAVGRGKLLVGATVIGETDRAVPNTHLHLKRGMQVTVTRPFGELAPLATYLSCLADDEYLGKLDEAGLDMATLARARQASLRAITTPALEAAEVVRTFCPPFGEPPELSEHLAATLDLSGRGVLGFPEFAARHEVELRLSALPLSHPAISSFATRAFLMDNATASAPGAFALFAWPSVLDEVDRALEAKGLDPARVGEVVGRGPGAVRAPAELAGAVASKRLLRQTVLEAPAGGATA